MIKFLKKIRYRLVGLAISLADILVPKRALSFSFVVGRTTVFSGNLKATFDYFSNNFSGKISLLAYATSDMCLLEGNCSVQVIKTDSLLGLWSLLRTKCIIVEYSRSDWFWPGLNRSRHIFVNLWHGIPIKRIGFAESQSEYMKKESEYIDLCIASSHVDRSMMSSCFGVSYNDVLMTGYPRNDWLISFDDTSSSRRLKKMERRVIDVKDGQKLVLYAPTYRGVYAPRNATNTGVYSFSDQELVELKALLVRYDAVLGIRPHLNKKADFDFSYGDRIVDMSRDVFPDAQMLLRNTDVLVSDYSGIWVDYLLMDRPIVGFVHDKDSYSSERGYLYDYDSIFPGPLVETADDFFVALEEALSGKENDEARAQRGFAKNLFHYYDDGNAGKRVFDELLQRVGA